jgi:hypothetical protein
VCATHRAEANFDNHSLGEIGLSAELLSELRQVSFDHVRGSHQDVSLEYQVRKRS